MREHNSPRGTFALLTRVGLSVTALLLAIEVGVQVIEGGTTGFGGWILLLGLLISAAVNYSLTRDILYPAFMFSSVWCLAALTYVFFPFEIDTLSWTTVCIFLGGNVCFSLGCALGNRPLSRRPAWFTAPTVNPQPRRFLLVYSIIAVPLAVYATMKLAGVFSLSSAMFVAARQAVVDIQTDGKAVNSNVFVSMAPTIAVSNAFVLIMEEGNRWLVATGIAATVVLGLFTTGRVIWMVLFCGWLVLALLRAKDRSIKEMAKKVTGAGLLALLALTVLPLLTKNETQKENSEGKSAVGIATGMTAAYVAGPLAGFNYIVSHPDTFHDQSNNTFAEILTPLSAFGLHYNPPPPFDPFLPVPFLINVFTAYKLYYVDFGVLGCLIAFLFFGFLSGAVFRSAVRGNQLVTFFFAYLFFALIFTPFQDAYHLFHRYAYMVTYGLAYFVVFRQTPPPKLIFRRWRRDR
jgi:oligosaccharide repeat unit polymerase